MQKLAAHIKAIGFVGTDGHRGIPVETQFGVSVLGQGLNGFYHFLVAVVAPNILGALHFGIGDVLGGMLQNAKSIAVSNRDPVCCGDASARTGWTAPGAIVLKSAVNIVGLRIVQADVVELRQGQVLDHFKSGSAIVAAVHSAIGSGIHPVRIFYVKDHIMNIGVHTPQAFEGLSSVP